MGSPAELRPVSNEPLTLHMTEDAKVVYQAVGRAAGVNVLFDPDYNSKRIQVDLNGVSLLDALRIVGTMSDTFWRPVTANTIFVAQNTRAKRTELDEQAVRDLLPDQRLAAERPERRTDRPAQRAAQRQGIRRGQPECHRDARHAGRVAAGAKADERPGQGAARGDRGHCRAGGEQELGAEHRHFLAQQRGRCAADRKFKYDRHNRHHRYDRHNQHVQYRPPSTIWPT